MPNILTPSDWFTPVSEEIQTRSEETGLIQHKTLNSALIAAEQDKTIWKISYSSRFGRHIYIRDTDDPNNFYGGVC